MAEEITVETLVNAPVEKVWKMYNQPEHVTQWNNASADWHTPRAENDLKVGGTFVYRMESRDGTEGFDFGGTYDEVVEQSLIKYTMSDGRHVEVSFKDENGQTKVVVSFDPESENAPEFQRQGWQAILDNFKQYVEKN